VRSLRAGDFFCPKERVMEVLYEAETDLQAIVEGFERCNLKLDKFTHARHLSLATYYLTKFPFHEALVRMRAGLQRFIAHHGKQGYHETITRFWMELISGFLNGILPDTAVTERANEVVARYGSKEILFEYYTRERVMSEIARREWVEPDLKSLP
jgi:hypothetical protein